MHLNFIKLLKIIILIEIFGKTICGKHHKIQKHKEGKLCIFKYESVLFYSSFLYLYNIESFIGPNPENNVCLRPNCVKTANMILQNIDTSINPCDNFYQFACGNYIKSTIIPDDKSTVNTPHSIGDLLEEKLRLVLESDTIHNDLRAFKLAKKLYGACMNIDAIESNSVQTVLKYLQKFGGWPVLEGKEWNEELYNWQKTTYDFHQAGFGSGYLLRLYIFLDPKNSSRTVLFINQALLGLKREYLSKGMSDILVKAYFSYMIDVAIMLGADETAATAELKKSLEFEINLAKISIPKEDLRNFTTLYNPISIRDLQKQYPSISWYVYINRFLNDVSITYDEIVILQAPSYIGQMLTLLDKTPKRVQANYLFWRIVENSVSFLTNDMRSRLLIYMQIMSGSTALPERWRECVSVVNNGMPIAVGALYVRSYFSKAAKQEATEMVNNIRMQLREILEDVSWMDRQTLRRALQKLDSMKAHVGYPDELLNDTLVEQYYNKLNIFEENYLESVLEITKFERLYEFRSLHSVVNKSSWVDHANAAVVNAFYTFSENSINLPAGILQEAFFETDRPRYMNYGAIGTVIGHEIIHGYDDKGRQYDKDGNLMNWWKENTSKNFIRRAQCFIDQYASYKDGQVNMHLNGINTQGENIADNGGVKAAYKAYKHWVSEIRKKQEPKLPGLHYTPNQMFWLSMANAFCSKSRPEYSRLIITTDEHSPAMYRVLGTLSNMNDFAKDFKCVKNTTMNPQKKCILW